jgi:signal transduction histidine kinase
MKKILISRFPILLATITLLIVTSFLRYNLYINSKQLTREFLNQNSNELYSMDTLKVSSRLNSFSRALNWVCIEGEVNSKVFFSMKKGSCETGLFQQNVEIKIPEANNSKISFTLKSPKDLEILFLVFFLMQIALIATLILATRKAEEDKMKTEREISKLSRKMFHDIRSPLAALNTISDSTRFDSKAEHDIFKTSISRINEIANTLLQRTKNNPILLPLYGSLETTVLEIIEEKKREYSNLTINYEKHSTALAFFEPSELKRVLSNLINNSVEAAQNEPIIFISIQQHANQIDLMISDNGSGIPQKIITQIGASEVTTKKAGNGIGLKDAFESMSEWGGQLSIIETSKRGTQLKLTFSIKDENKFYILIDDDSLTRITWENRAKKAGVELRTFEGPEDFFAHKDKFPKNSILYIDSELGKTKGEVLAFELHNEGFNNISLTTGHSAENFKTLKFLKSVISKDAPF